MSVFGSVLNIHQIKIIYYLSNTFESLNKKSKLIYKYQSYKFLIDDYIDRPILPPPFIIISFTFSIIIKLIEFCKKKSPSNNKIDPENIERYSRKVRASENKKRYYILVKREGIDEDFKNWYREMTSGFFPEYIKKWE